jgi:hypothetical protein
MIAKDHHLFIVPVHERGRAAWVVYRQNPVKGERAFRLGRSSNPTRLLAMVKQFAGVTEAPQPTQGGTHG